MFKVPRETLDDRIKGCVKHGVSTLKKKNPSPRTSYGYMAECGLPLTITMVKVFAWAIAKHSGYGPNQELPSCSCLSQS